MASVLLFNLRLVFVLFLSDILLQISFAEKFSHVHNLFLRATKFKNDYREKYVGATSRCGCTSFMAYYQFCTEPFGIPSAGCKTICVLFFFKCCLFGYTFTKEASVSCFLFVCLFVGFFCKTTHCTILCKLIMHGLLITFLFYCCLYPKK